jgi:FkbM family methyltransferase
MTLRGRKRPEKPSGMKLKELIRELLPRRIALHRIQGGPIRGAGIWTSWHDYPGAILGTTERPLMAWFARNVKPGETWLDIGAHYGYTTIALARLVGASGRVFAFEPVRETAACIERTRGWNRLDQMTVIPLGLSAEAEVCTKSLPMSRGMADSTVTRVTQQKIIKTVSLDSFWSRLNGANPAVHGVKIDVQGMEGEVLAGMQNLLPRARPKLIVEFHRGVDRRIILDLIESFGYLRIPEPIGGGFLTEIADDCSYAFSLKS